MQRLGMLSACLVAFLAGESNTLVLQIFKIDKEKNEVEFADGIRMPLKPFTGVMGVAPDTDEMLNTIPPRANGGNLDDPNLVAGTTVYFPVCVKGGLFSIGDTHSVQRHGEVSGTATDKYYATTWFATTIDEAAKKATRFMIDYLVETNGLSLEQAYMLCSITGDLKIAKTVDVPHMLVTMHMLNSIFVGAQPKG